MRLTGTLYDQTGNRKSNMAAAKTEVLITQLADQLGTRFQRQNYMFLGFPNSMEQMQYCTIAPEVGNPIWRPPKRKTEVLPFGGRHVGFLTSDLVVEHCIWFH